MHLAIEGGKAPIHVITDKILLSMIKNSQQQAPEFNRYLAVVNRVAFRSPSLRKEPSCIPDSARTHASGRA